MDSFKIIEDFLLDNKDNRDYWLALDSEYFNDTINYRADLGYMFTGKFAPTIKEACDELVKEMIRCGVII